VSAARLRDVGLSRATDEVVWHYAAQHGHVILSKDAELPAQLPARGTSKRYCATGTRRRCRPSTIDANLARARFIRQPPWGGGVENDRGGVLSYAQHPEFGDELKGA
jgi:hypothetical protein